MIIKSKQAEEHFDRGINYFRGEFYSSALQEFIQVRNIEPAYPNIDFIIEAAIKRNREVVGQLTNFIEENFDAEIQELSNELTVENSSMLGPEVNALLKRGNFSEALRKLKHAESVVPDSRPLLLLLGNTQRRLGLLDEAEKTLQHAAHLYPEDSEILNNLGNVLLDMSLYKDAEDVFRAALRLAPENPRLLNNLGAMRMQTNNLDDAERLFCKVLKLQPRWVTVQKNLQNLRQRIEALDSDIENLRTEFVQHPDYLDIGLALGKSLFFRGYFSEARTTLKGVLKKNPRLVAACFYLATIYELTDDNEKAIEYYRQMVLKNGKEDTLEFVNFESLLKQEFYEEALSELKKIAILELDVAASRINLGIKYFEDCQWNDALRHFEEAININDTYPDAFYWTALALVQLSETVKAKESLEKAIELNPDYADAHFQLGMLLRSKAKKKARIHFSKALSLNLRPSFARIAQQLIDEQK
ncbi:MAG: tetratricopeptide repeat protein [Candidatus Riflebacteria bacterium]|nr:tetratricopeptide repeat protein [Candidatus Riflebacteria bacterium]